MKYMKLYEELDVSVKVAIYNASKQELICVVDNMKLAARYIYGETVDSRAPDKIRQKMLSKNRIKIGNSIHPFDIAVRNASTKQIEQMGINKWLFFGEYKSPWKFNDSKL